MARPENFELLTPLDKLEGRRSITFSDRRLVDPTFANCAMDGEFFQVDANGELVRFVNDGNHRDAGNQNAGLVTSYPLLEQIGTTDKQASGKGTAVTHGSFRVKSYVVDTTGLYSGAPLEVADITYDGRTVRGLRLANTGVVVGRVEKFDAAAGWVIATILVV